MSRSDSRLIDAARELRSTIDANARRAGGAPVPRETVEAMHAAGLYGIMAPREVGGAELPLVGPGFQTRVGWVTRPNRIYRPLE